MPKVHFGKNGGAYVMKAGKKKYLSQFGTGIDDLSPEILAIITGGTNDQSRARLSRANKGYRGSWALSDARPINGISRDQRLAIIRSYDLVDNLILTGIVQNFSAGLDSIQNVINEARSVPAFPWDGTVIPIQQSQGWDPGYADRVSKYQYNLWRIGRGGSGLGPRIPHWPLREDFDTADMEQYRNQAMRQFLPTVSTQNFGRH